jgi:hypothetical protein
MPRTPMRHERPEGPPEAFPNGPYVEVGIYDQLREEWFLPIMSATHARKLGAELLAAADRVDEFRRRTQTSEGAG